jgi:hypothetical protein
VVAIGVFSRRASDDAGPLELGCRRFPMVTKAHGMVTAATWVPDSVVRRRDLHPLPARRAVRLDQPHPLQARMPALADDDVVVHGNAERGSDSMIAFVIWMSACDGVGSPLG